MTPWTFSGRAHCLVFFFVVLFHDLMLFSVVPDWSRCDHGIGSSRPLIPCSVKPVATCETRGSSWRKYAWFVVNTLEIIPLNWEIQSVHISANISVTSHFAGVDKRKQLFSFSLMWNDHKKNSICVSETLRMPVLVYNHLFKLHKEVAETGFTVRIVFNLCMNVGSVRVHSKTPISLLCPGSNWRIK